MLFLNHCGYFKGPFHLYTKNLHNPILGGNSFPTHSVYETFRALTPSSGFPEETRPPPAGEPQAPFCEGLGHCARPVLRHGTGRPWAHGSRMGLFPSPLKTSSTPAPNAGNNTTKPRPAKTVQQCLRAQGQLQHTGSKKQKQGEPRKKEMLALGGKTDVCG